MSAFDDRLLPSVEAARPPAAPEPTPEARYTAVSRVLRGAGSVALVAAFSTFLWQHWQSGSDLARAATLLAHTIALALAGLLCGLGARDGKAARTFLGLASASVPIVACVAGGLLYSQVAWDGGSVGVARYATWVAPSPAAALAAAAMALASIVPVAVLTMGVLARRQARSLAAAFVAGNALLLLPTRDPDAIALLAAAALLGLTALELRVLRRDPTLANFEGGLARVLAAAPPLLLFARSLLHYDLSPLLAAVGWLSAAVALTGVSWLRVLPEELRVLARWAALAPAAAAGATLRDALLGVGMAPELGLPVAAGAFAAQLAIASLPAGDARWGGAFRAFAGLAFAGACVANLLVAPGIASSLLAGVASIAVLAWGTLRGDPALQLGGAAGALAAVAVHVKHAIELYAWSRWGSLALLGAAVIVCASLVERFGPAAASRLARWKRRSAWDD